MKPWKDRTPLFDQHPKVDLFRYYARRYNVDYLILKLLYQRGIRKEANIIEFLHPSLEQLHDPFLLNDMKKAIHRIAKAITTKERIIIFGDYDMDGISSSCLLYQALLSFNANVDVILPLRSEGYGLSKTAVEKVSGGDVSLIITVDNGSSAHEALAVARNKGIDVIVTDHHDILHGYPDCYAFINPKRSDNRYPYPYLAGAGVALKVVQALLMNCNRHWKKNLWHFLEFAALGTIADVMPLTGENRVIVSLGLRRMKQNPNPALKALFDYLKLDVIDSSAIGFKIAPIFNATGRIGDPNTSVQFLCAPTPSVADIKGLVGMNEKRKKMTLEQFQSVDQQIMDTKLYKKNVIVVYGDCHDGIIGLVAARISEKYHKPSIVISKNGKGSARSVQDSDFSIVNTIERCSRHLQRFGGHQAAAGLSIEVKHLEMFSEDIQKAAIHEPDIDLTTFYDSQIDLSTFNNHFFNDLHLLEPFGQGNRKPIFYCPPSKISSREHIGHEKHLKFYFGKKQALLFNYQRFHSINFDNHVEFLCTPNLRNKGFIIEDIRNKGYVDIKIGERVSGVIK
jgi:single-stranded-DNA-specific exonuclease